jgi:hypothetical protein
MAMMSADIRKEVVDAATKDAEACWSALAGKMSADK